MMSIFHGFTSQPRRTWIRRALFQIHLWAGLAIGLYAFIIGITGSVLVFHDELLRVEQPELYRVKDAAGGRVLTADEALASVRRHAQEARINTLFLPAESADTYRAAINANGKPSVIAVHPVTGVVVASGNGGGLLAWIRQLHFNLLTGRTGRLWNGVGGLLMALLCISGAVIWWQGKTNWKRGLQVSWQSGWKRINWDLHSFSGVTTVLLLFVISITGAYFSWPQVYRDLVARVAPVTPRAAPPKAEKGTTGQVPVTQVVAAAEAAVPGRRADRVFFGVKPADPLRVMLFESHSGHAAPSNTVFVDAGTGRVLRADLYKDRTTGDAIIGWIAPLHFGNFGGMAVKIIWALMGIAPALLFITGFLMWWNRVAKRTWSRWSEPARTVEREAVLK